MVNAYLIGKSPGLPTFHSCGNDRDMIDATALNGRISTNRFVALSPEQLAAAPDVFNVGKAVVVLQRSFFERRSADAESGVLAQTSLNRYRK